LNNESNEFFGRVVVTAGDLVWSAGAPLVKDEAGH
jgi:hypothetical protein